MCVYVPLHVHAHINAVFAQNYLGYAVAYTVYTVYTVFTVCTVCTVYTMYTVYTVCPVQLRPRLPQLLIFYPHDIVSSANQYLESISLYPHEID